VLTECAREGFVRAVAGFERHGENVRRAVDELSGCVTQATGTDVGRERTPDGHAEGTGDVESRHPDGLGDYLERQVSAQVAFDVPESLGSDAHDDAIMTGPRGRRLTVVAVSDEQRAQRTGLACDVKS
jgi:hypothetical protein